MTDIDYIKSHAKSRKAYGVNFYNTNQQRGHDAWFETKEEAEHAIATKCEWTTCNTIGWDTLYHVQCHDYYVRNRWCGWVTESEMKFANERQDGLFGTYYTATEE